jgi:hypothetical protein
MLGFWHLLEAWQWLLPKRRSCSLAHLDEDQAGNHDVGAGVGGLGAGQGAPGSQHAASHEGGKALLDKKPVV